MSQPEFTIKTILKRNGRQMPFDVQKITDAIFKAVQAVGGKDREQAYQLALKVIEKLQKKFKEPTVENVQDAVEETLIDEGHARTAKAFILYRYKKNEERAERTLILGEKHAHDELSLSNEALKILERRYLLKDHNGNLTETPHQMFERVANCIAKADLFYGASQQIAQESARDFYDIMAQLEFLPNTPTLSNANRSYQQLSACFVLPIEDTMESIFGTLRDAAVIHQRGSGTGFSFSRLRPQGDLVAQHLGVASGPLSFLRVYDAALDAIKQGGVRPGANMAVLRVDHPDILRFIEAKRDKRSLKNFNISVAVTDRFMKAVEEDREYFLKSPRTEKFVGKLRARDVFAVITQNAWKTGDPGLLFIDEINRRHPAKHLGEIETTNQCGEAPLLAYEGCALGSIDVAKFIKGNDLDWSRLAQTIKTSVHFLDNVIDVNIYPSKEVEEHTKRTRKFGLGIMGLADMLFALKIEYDSDAGLVFVEKLIAFFKQISNEKSQELAKQRGTPPGYSGSDHEKEGRLMRNLTTLALSPTGTRSILANTSAGCEPAFAIAYQRTLMGSGELVSINEHFERVAKERGFYSPDLIRKITFRGSVQSIKEIPKDVRDVFVTAQDISPQWHIRMQATLQKHVDNAISKTINLPNTVAIKDVEEAYLLAWKLKCKGITIYRDGSYEDQVINIGDSM